MRAEMIPYFFPANDVAALRVRNVLRTLHEIFVGIVGSEAFGRHPSSDGLQETVSNKGGGGGRGYWGVAPALCVNFVSSKMHHVVREQPAAPSAPRYVGEQAVQQVEGGLSGGVQRLEA